jgi:predicted nucleic acid-binding protein
MMAIVIDSTVAVVWLVEDESGTASEAVLDRLRNDEAVVPSVWHLEVTNALLVAEANGKLTEAQAAHLLVLLAQLPITIGAPMQVALASVATAYQRSVRQRAFAIFRELDAGEDTHTERTRRA